MRAMWLGLIVTFTLNSFAATDFSECVIRVTSGKHNVTHNLTIEELMKDGPTPAKVRETILLLIRVGAFDFPVDENGFIPAANVGNHRGDYGRFLWARDMARVYQGLSAYQRLLEIVEPAYSEFKSLRLETRDKVRRLTSAMAKVAASPQWTYAATTVIKNPAVADDDLSGFMNVIWIRRLLLPFVENREPHGMELNEESRWGHKQNDAIGELTVAILDALDRGHLKYADLPNATKLNLHLLPAYFAALKYWWMWDVGAWEETMGLHASSVGVVTVALERLRARGGFPDSAVPEDLQRLVENSYRDLDRTIDNGYETFVRQLLQGRLEEARYAQPNGTRFEDSAIFHVLWGKLEQFTIENRLKILEGLKVNERGSGYIRYAKDWFLYGAAEAAKNLSKVPFYRLLAVPGNNGRFVPATLQDIDAIVELHEAHEGDKNMDPVIERAGEGLEAQWTIFDPMVGTEYAELFNETGDPRYRAKALEHFARMVGQLTGYGMVTTEGQPVLPFRWPEAYVPVRILARGVPRLAFVVSPNSPLNWATAEASILALKAWELTEDPRP